MLSLLSIGISNYSLAKCGNISCARDDAFSIYDALKDIMQEEFCEHNSICLQDIFAHDYLSLLHSISYSLISPEDILVLFFSGHATNVNNYGSETDYSLCFADYNENLDTGYVSLNNQIIPALNRINTNIVLILDCCFSGMGLHVASSHTCGNHISVLSGSSDRQFSYYSKSGSYFSEAICKSIFEIKASDEDFTLEKLQSTIQNYYSRAQFNIAAGSKELIIKNKNNYKEVFFDFDKRFLKRISSTNDSHIKEATWYSLIDVPTYLKIRVYEKYFHCLNEASIFPSELNWLVRRAIGSSISCISDVNYRKSIVEKLLLSSLWQEQCIGIIAARYDVVTDNSIFQLLLNKISTDHITKIDAVWLANLYASDNPDYDYQLFARTSLVVNSWGINELYKCARKSSGFNLKDFLCVLNTSEYVKQEWVTAYTEPHTWEKSSKLYRIMASKNERGRLPENSKAKFILSSLYGNWRGYRLYNLKTYLEDNSKDKIKKELNEIQYYSEVEYRMSIFDYFLSETELLEELIESLKWGLNDVHPWVRRTAIQCFKAANILKNECNQSILEYLEMENNQIGVFDLLMEYDSDDSCLFWTSINRLGLSSNEIKELRKLVEKS